MAITTAAAPGRLKTRRTAGCTRFPTNWIIPNRASRAEAKKKGKRLGKIISHQVVKAWEAAV
jgi:hypothetical protein